MITFVVLAAAMLLAAVAWVLVPLLKRRPDATLGREESNLRILRDARAELETDLAQGTLSAEQYESARAELDRRVLEETNAAEGASVAPPRSSAVVAAVVAGVLPIAAVVLYLVLGAPAALSPDAAKMAAAEDGGADHATSPQQIEAMVEQVKQKLESDPNNVDGWVVLARTYYVTGRAEEAAKAYAKATALLPNDADLLADYADALGVAQGRTLDGKPAELVAQALKADPNHWKANALAGTIAFNRKEYAKAVGYWERTKAAVPPDSPVAQTIAGSITEARQLAGMPAASAATPAAPAAAMAAAPTAAPMKAAPVGGGARVTGKVALSPTLAANASPDDAVIVFARPADGSRMPLALFSGKKVKDLPLEFTLDDSMAMSPTMKLSDHGQVIVGARVSRTGSPMPASGDLEGLSPPVKLGTSGVALTIDRRIP